MKHSELFGKNVYKDILKDYLQYLAEKARVESLVNLIWKMCMTSFYNVLKKHKVKNIDQIIAEIPDEFFKNLKENLKEKQT